MKKGAVAVAITVTITGGGGRERIVVVYIATATIIDIIIMRLPSGREGEWDIIVVKITAASLPW